MNKSINDYKNICGIIEDIKKDLKNYNEFIKNPKMEKETLNNIRTILKYHKPL